VDLSVLYTLGESDEPLLLPRTLRTIMKALPDAKVHFAGKGWRIPRRGAERYESPLTQTLAPYREGIVKERIVAPDGHKRVDRWWRYELSAEWIAAVKPFRPAPYAMPNGEWIEDLGVTCRGVWLLDFVDHERQAWWWWNAKDEAELARIGWKRPQAR
jgi:hypothetical protein